MLLNQDQDLLADLSIAICSSFVASVDTSGQTAEEQNLKKCVFWDTLMPTYHVTGKKQC